ncbi:MAG: arginyl-tRNA--protein-N-Asp/Glu arginylyltransferase [Kiritimatiellia bacterium]|jgi:arginyl-tRNA--protein-N-Asp/Glu arginylyltransferase
MPLYRQQRKLSPAQADERFARAERRVGFSLYRTECPTCTACTGLRVVVSEFRPTRSQRRVAKRWRALGDRLRVTVGVPSWSEDKLAMFNRHKLQRGLADEQGELMDAYGYAAWLMHSCMLTIEMCYYIDDQLVAVGIVDVGQASASSVYFYFDPSDEISRLSPGVYSVMREVAWCARTNRSHYYLGLWVRDCASLSYKANYHPHELLRDGVWRRATLGDQEPTQAAQK